MNGDWYLNSPRAKFTPWCKPRTAHGSPQGVRGVRSWVWVGSERLCVPTARLLPGVRVEPGMCGGWSQKPCRPQEPGGGGLLGEQVEASWNETAPPHPHPPAPGPALRPWASGRLLLDARAGPALTASQPARAWSSLRGQPGLRRGGLPAPRRGFLPDQPSARPALRLHTHLPVSGSLLPR